MFVNFLDFDSLILFADYLLVHSLLLFVVASIVVNFNNSPTISLDQIPFMILREMGQR
jgi:hypothetical protein